MCGGPTWKREVVPDHKFDFIDTRDFRSKAFGIRLQYIWVYILVIKSFLVYISDIYTATTMLTSKDWSNKIFNSCQEKDGCVAISFDIAKWLFVGCIIFSFLLLAYEAYKSKKIIASRDISFAFTNVMATDYYSLRSYDHFCFFCHINDSTKKKDDFAFFIFFTFKEWKRLLLADAPRQTINGLTLYSFYLSRKQVPGEWYDVSKYLDKEDMVTNVLLVAMVFTVLIFAGSLLLLVAAAICYVPLLCYIQGNLKEYCCHKVDKRISELVKRKQKQRLAKQAQIDKARAAGKTAKGDVDNLPQPTLPTVSLDDDEDLKKPAYSERYASSVKTANDSYWAADHKDDYNGGAYMPDYPAMPAYNPEAYPPQPGYPAYGNFDESSLYGHDDYRPNGYISRGGTPANGYGNDASIARGGTPANAMQFTNADQYGARGGTPANAGIARGATPANAAQYDNNAVYGNDQYADRFTPDPYGNDPYGRNAGYTQDAGYGAYGAQQQQQQQQQQPQQPWDNAPAYQDQYQTAQQQGRVPSRNMPSRGGYQGYGGGTQY